MKVKTGISLRKILVIGVLFCAVVILLGMLGTRGCAREAAATGAVRHQPVLGMTVTNPGGKDISVLWVVFQDGSIVRYGSKTKGATGDEYWDQFDPKFLGFGRGRPVGNIYDLLPVDAAEK